MIGKILSSLKNKERKLLYFLFFISISFFSGQTLSQKVFDPFVDQSKSKVLVYKIESKDTVLDKKILRLEYNSNFFLSNQQTLMYDYCNSYDECKGSFQKVVGDKVLTTHYEVTGFTKKSNSLWLHSPRADYFGILELNAFPYYMTDKNKWDYSLSFGKDWIDRLHLKFDGFLLTVSSQYEKNGEVFYTIGNEKISCIEIKAKTNIPQIGDTETIFYYNEKYGFVKMIFSTISKNKLEFNLIEVL